MSDTEQKIQQAIELHRGDKTADGLVILDELIPTLEDARVALFVRGCLRVGSEDVANAILDWETALDGDLQLAAALHQEHTSLVDKALYDFHFETTVEANDANVHSALGRALRLFGRFDEAILSLVRSSELSRSMWRDGVSAAELQLKMGQVDQALALVSGLLESREDNGELHYHVGRIYHMQNSLAFALRHLERAVQLEPGDWRPRLSLGEIYVLQARFDQAEPQLAKVLQLSPSARAHLSMAEAVRGQYRFDEALTHLRSAVDLEPRNLTALTELGSLALQFGDLELGQDCLRRALEIDPSRAELFGLLAKAAQQKGDVEEAINSYRKLLDLSPLEAQPNHALGLLLAGRGENAEAARYLEKALELMRGDVQVTLDLARAYMAVGKDQDAAGLLRESFARNPHHLDTKTLLQQLDPSAVPVDRTLSSNLTTSGEEHNPWLDSSEREPEQVIFEGHMKQARSLLAEGQEADALKSFRAALALRPKDRDCLVETGRLYARRGMPGLGADLLHQGYALNPHDFSLLPELVQCLSRADEMERDETMASLVLGLPASLDRRGFVEALAVLRGSEELERLRDTVVQGLCSRFPSDTELRAHWEALRAAPPDGPVAAQEPVAAETEPELVALDPEPAADLAALEPAEPDPVAVEPDPVAVEPEPVVAEPEPVAAEPEPVAAEPEPVAAEPEPVAAEPEPAVVEAQAIEAVPVAVEPESAAVEAEPVEAVPVAIQPELVALELEPVESEPVVAELELPPTEPAAGEPDVQPEPGTSPELPPEPEPVAAVEPGPVAIVAAVAAAAVPEEPAAPPPWVAGELVEPAPAHLELWRIQPRSPQSSPAEVLRQAAWKLANLGHYREAVLTLARALEWEPAVGAAWLEQLLGMWTSQLEQSEQLAAALQVCQSWCELFPDQPEAARRLKELTPVPPPPLEVEIACEDLGQALEALRSHPGNEGLISKALSLGEGRDDELLNVFRVLTRDHVDEPLHFRNFARAYLRQNKPILAVVQYQKYLVARPTPEGYRELAEAYTLLKREKNAADALRKAEELASG